MANLLSTSVSGSLSSTGRISTTYNTDRYQFNLVRSSGSNWWFTNDSDKLGLHINNVGDKFYFGTGGDFWSSANGWLSTALDNRAPKAYITDSYVEFTIEGDANTYYPVTIHNWNGTYSWQRYSIHRGYSDTAPWDPIGTGSHRGGLTFAFEWAGDIAWGGNDKSIRVIEFNETYTTMVAGLELANCEGVVVWLRGGGAYYRLHGPGGRSQSYSINMSTWTSCAGVQYSPRSYDSGRVNTQIYNRYPLRGIGDTIYAQSFVDINDEAYYLNPNGTSNLVQLTESTRARWNMPRVWYDRSSRTSNQGYWTGTNGWATYDGTWANAWKGGFSGWDIWGANTDHPQGAGDIHAQGIVSGIHYSSSDGSSAYGWMMVGANGAVANRYWLRGKWDTTTSDWVEMITTGNIGSQSVNYATSAGGVSWANVSSKPTTISGYGITDAITTSNIGSQSVNYATSSNITEFQNIPDYRGNAYTPNQYDGKRVWWHFNNRDTVGGYGTYWHAIQTVSPWSSYDASHRQQQIQWGGTDISFRYATSGTTWSPWYRFITDASIGSQNVNSASYSNYVIDSSSVRITSPVGAFSVNNGYPSGAIRINLPRATYQNNTMMSMTVDVYEYSTGQSFTLRIGGYNYLDGAWYNVFASLVSDSGQVNNIPVYFGNNGSDRNVIWIGEPNWSFAYPNVFVRDFQAGHSQNSGWVSDWSISFDSGSRTNVSNSRIAYKQIDAGNITSSHFHDLARYSLRAPGNVDSMTSSNFRTQLFGSSSSGHNISTARWNSVPSGLSGMNMYGTMLAWSGSDTHGFIAADYSTANIQVGGGSGDSITWKATLIHSGNIGSQSVSYASSAGNADTVDNYHASGLWRSDGGNWNPGANITLYQTGNGQEWSFDIFRQGYTGGYWHVWDSSHGTMLGVDATSNYVYATGSFRAPIFYDSNDTTYYADFASTGIAIQARGLIRTWGGNSGSGAGWDTAIEIGETSAGTVNGNFPTYITGYGVNIRKSSDGCFLGLVTYDGGSNYHSVIGWGDDSGEQLQFRFNNAVVATMDYAGNYTANSSLRAPIFYDSQDTSYYVDPNSASQFSSVYANNWFRPQGGTGLYFQTFGYGIYSADSGGSSYGNVATYSEGVNSWPGYAIKNYACFMARDIRRGIFIPTQDSWLIRWESSDNMAHVDFELQWGSDIRHKSNIKRLSGSLDKVKQLKGVSYNYKDNERTSIGFIAQEVEPILPEVVSTDADGFKSVGYANIVALLSEAIKEQQAMIEELKARIEVLESK